MLSPVRHGYYQPLHTIPYLSSLPPCSPLPLPSFPFPLSFPSSSLLSLLPLPSFLPLLLSSFPPLPPLSFPLLSYSLLPPSFLTLLPFSLPPFSPLLLSLLPPSRLLPTSLSFLSPPLSLLGERMWQRTYGSPVVAIYTPEVGGELRKVPMRSVGRETMGLLTESSVLAIRTNSAGIKPTDTVLK